MNKALVGVVLLFGFNSATQAGSSPAQVGYCVESLKYWINQMSESLACPKDTSPEQCAILMAPMRQTLDAQRRLFDSWRLTLMSILSNFPDASLELLRGQAQAKSDIAYVNSRVNALMSACNSAADPQACYSEKSKEPDSMTAGVQERSSPCFRGPQL